MWTVRTIKVGTRLAGGLRGFSYNSKERGYNCKSESHNRTVGIETNLTRDNGNGVPMDIRYW